MPESSPYRNANTAELFVRIAARYCLRAAEDTIGILVYETRSRHGMMNMVGPFAHSDRADIVSAPNGGQQWEIGSHWSFLLLCISVLAAATVAHDRRDGKKLRRLGVDSGRLSARDANSHAPSLSRIIREAMGQRGG